jgi:outer membrane protein assembly factor BamA
MAKVNHCAALLWLLTLLCSAAYSQNYPVSYRAVAGDSSLLQQLPNLQKSFISRTDANGYMARLLPLLREKGYLTASIDTVRLDSSGGRVSVYLGEQYKWAKIRLLPQDAPLLQQVHFPSTVFNGKVDFPLLRDWQQKILDYLEENGHPFGKTWLDSVSIVNDEMIATLRINSGPEYKIDSIRVYGNAKVDNLFLQKYLDIPAGSFYNKQKLNSISKKLAELTFLQEDRPSNLTMLGTGSVLNLYLQQKKSSQVNALLGFLPNTDPLVNKKLLLTVDANVLLRNALGVGETIGLIWQQLQQRSPRLNILYEQPFLFHSPVGLTFNFDMYKQDSNYLNINMKLGGVYKVGLNQAASLFLLNRQTIVNGINAAAIIQTKRLPLEADVSSLNLGFSYDYNNTDYRLNPRKGNEFNLTTSAGNKKVKKNDLVMQLEDPSDPSFKFASLYDTIKQGGYQYRITASGAHYIQLAHQSTLKLAANAGIYQSGSIYRNELFQIGGYRLLRGFNEESQFVSRYGIATIEYRYLIGLNSAFFAFADAGWGKHLLEVKQDHTYLGTGLGLSFETRAGIINLAWAVGKRDDGDLNLRDSKIHIGFASYF